MTTAGAREPHPFTLAEAEAIVAALLAEGYSARSYKRHPAGYRVVVTGVRNRHRFTYAIDTAEDYAAMLAKVPIGQTGADKPYTEGE